MSGDDLGEHRVPEARHPEDRSAEDRFTDDRLTADRLAEDGLVEDRLTADRLVAGRLAGDRPVEERLTENRFPDDRLPGNPLTEDRLTDDGPDEAPDGVTDDGPEPEEMYQSGPEVEVELRPQRRLRLWQLAPIVGLSAVGSLMFAFPLAFDFGDSGAVIAMLGLLICSCAAGWGMMAARRVGYTWPGLPARGSARRPDWRVVLGYVLLVALVVVLAVWRVARLR
ncbi:membrane protein [Streptomyces incarnatus]|uniref:Membrane protein n=1 Tax=Streptomyces incarnatus TaxID=665007 RepID=A0ABM5THB1_9ACTN|nr:membrane protein [Streptomyces incarnatus]